MKPFIAAIVLMAGTAGTVAHAQTCDSIAASYGGNWQPVSTAPRDGTTVEMLETFGVAPWYGLFKWTKDDGWMRADGSSQGVMENYCLFWRPYKPAPTTPYVDPTGGAQDKVAYWCAYMHIAYDPKTDACIDPTRKKPVAKKPTPTGGAQN